MKRFCRKTPGKPIKMRENMKWNELWMTDGTNEREMVVELKSIS